MTSQGGIRLAALLGVVPAMVIFCLRSILHIACMCGTGGILVYSSSESQSPSLASVWRSLMASISWGPRFFSCSTSMLSMSAALLFLSADIPFLYSSSLNVDTNDGFLLQLVVQGTCALLASYLGH